MEDKQILELILKELQEIKQIQAQHTEKLNAIYEQTTRNVELKSTVKEHSVDILKLKDDTTLIKRLLAN